MNGAASPAGAPVGAAPPPPPRLPRQELAAVVSPVLLSFMSESRRLSNERLRGELGVRLRFPQVQDALAKIFPGT